MSTAESFDAALFSRLVDGLYVEAMVMADEARSYFDRQAGEEKGKLDMMTRLTFSCESLKVTTRLMHVIAWLLTQKAWQRGEITAQALTDQKYRLGQAGATEPSALALMPTGARELVRGSEALYGRVKRMQEQVLKALAQPASVEVLGENPRHDAADVPSPARDLLTRLEKAF